MDDVLKSRVLGLKAVVGMLGDIVRTDNPFYAQLGWRSGDENEKDNTGLVFSELRVRALAALYRINPSLRLIISGGQTNTKPTPDSSPTIAEVVAFELIHSGVPRTAIIVEGAAYTSVEQLINCADLCRDMRLETSEVALLAPFWQSGRIYAQLAHLPRERMEPTFAPEFPRLLSMERVLAAEDPNWNDRFTALYSTDQAKDMIAKEALGTGQLWAGHQPRFPKPFRDFTDPLLD